MATIGGIFKDVFKVSNDLFSPIDQLSRKTRDSHTAANRHLRASHLLPENKVGVKSVFGGIPRPKFLFGVRFYRQLGGNIPGQFSTDEGLGNSDTAFMLKNIDRPKVNFDIEELNQYNKKRLVHTGVKYQPLMMRFHDSVDDRVLKMFRDYYSHYFGDGRKSGYTDWTNDNYSDQFLDYGSGWGFAPYDELVGASQHFFSHIEIYHFFAGMYNTITLVHPRIEMFDHDSNDFSEGTTGAEIQMTVKYEGLVYSRMQAPLTPELATIFGIDEGTADYLKVGSIVSPLIGGIGDLGNARSRFLDAAGVPQQLKQFIPNLPVPIQGILNKVSSVNSALGTIGSYAHAAGQGVARVSQGTRAASPWKNPNDPASRAASAAMGPN